jgi:secreted trypsin-like serine protease
VKLSDALSKEELDRLPTYVSDGSKPDYLLYLAFKLGVVKMMIVEAKTDQSLSDDTIAQVIGYFIASKVNENKYQPVALILTQTKAQFIFFPYRSERVETRETVDFRDQINCRD